MTDRGNKDALIQIPECGSFKDLMKLKGDKDIGDEINKVIRNCVRDDILEKNYIKLEKVKVNTNE